MKTRLWTARILIGLVLTLNVQCALAFIGWPSLFAPGFEVSGAAGDAIVRGFGVLFLMWNVPYIVAAWQPLRQRVSLYQACAMQAIGLVGESAILAALPSGHGAASATLARFIAFDGAGLLALLIALALVEGWFIRPVGGAGGVRSG